MVARRPSRLALRFRSAARRPQAVMNIGQATRRAAARRVKPARSLREGRWADRSSPLRFFGQFVMNGAGAEVSTA